MVLEKNKHEGLFVFLIISGLISFGVVVGGSILILIYKIIQ